MGLVGSQAWAGIDKAMAPPKHAAAKLKVLPIVRILLLLPEILRATDLLAGSAPSHRPYLHRIEIGRWSQWAFAEPIHQLRIATRCRKKCYQVLMFGDR